MKGIIQESWKNLFKYHDSVASGEYEEAGAIEAALWQLKKEWVISRE